MEIEKIKEGLKAGLTKLTSFVHNGENLTGILITGDEAQALIEYIEAQEAWNKACDKSCGFNQPVLFEGIKL